MWAESEVASQVTAERKAAWIMYWFLPRSCNEDGERIDKPANGRADIPQLLPLSGFCLTPRIGRRTACIAAMRAKTIQKICFLPFPARVAHYMQPVISHWLMEIEVPFPFEINVMQPLQAMWSARRQGIIQKAVHFSMCSYSLHKHIRIHSTNASWRMNNPCFL